MGPVELLALSQTGGLALQRAEIIQLGAPHLTGANDINVVDHPGVNRENTLHALAKADLSHRDALAHSGIVAGDEGSLKGLQAFFIAFLNLHVDTERVAWTEGGDVGPLVLLNKF